MADRWKPLLKFPRLNSAKCNNANRVYLHPVIALGSGQYALHEGWRVVGWCPAPYPGAGKDAIVYEKTTPANDSDALHANLELGLYWGHGTASKMTFAIILGKKLAAEIAPWR